MAFTRCWQNGGAAAVTWPSQLSTGNEAGCGGTARRRVASGHSARKGANTGARNESSKSRVGWMRSIGFLISPIEPQHERHEGASGKQQLDGGVGREGSPGRQATD